MRIRRTKLLRLINKKMITLPWGVYAAPSADIKEIDVTHEFIHIKQWRELLYIGFLLWYVLEWLVRLPKGNAYRSISFEREAYTNEKELDYLRIRNRFAFIKYLSQ